MKPRTKKLARFRAIMVSVVISTISGVTPQSFTKVHHATLINLSEPHWLSCVCVCEVLYRTEALPLNMMAIILTIVHAAHEPDTIEVTKTKLVAWRNGIYAIVPSIIINVKVARDEFRFECIDHLWANVKVREDG